jgi:hypothetical protein
MTGNGQSQLLLSIPMPQLNLISTPTTIETKSMSIVDGNDYSFRGRAA